MKMQLAKAMAILVFVFGKLKKIVPEVVLEVEKAAEDKRITKDERKKIAMKVIEKTAEAFGIKFNFVIRMITSRLIDKLAKKLPQGSINIPDIIAEICEKRGFSKNIK